MLPTRSLSGSGQSTQFSCTRHALSPSLAATAATCRVWLDWTPPMVTSVSAPWARVSGTRYSSLRILLPPNARPLLTVLALGPDLGAAEVLRQSASGWTGLGPNISG